MADAGRAEHIITYGTCTFFGRILLCNLYQLAWLVPEARLSACITYPSTHERPKAKLPRGSGVDLADCG